MASSASETKPQPSAEVRTVEARLEKGLVEPQHHVDGEDNDTTAAREVMGAAERKSIRRERWAYYSYFAGANGMGPFVLTNLLFQNLLQQAGFNPLVHPLGSQSCEVDATAPCHVFWANGTKSTASVILISTAITLVGQALLFLSLGSMADYGAWAPWIVRVSTVLCFALQMGLLGVHDASRWEAALGLFIVSNITFWTSYVFFNALFPKLAADQPAAIAAQEQLEAGQMSAAEHRTRIQLTRSRILNRSWFFNNVGFCACGALTVGILAGLDAQSSVSRNNLGYSVAVAVAAAASLALCVPWFLWEKRRAGQPVPAGASILRHGPAQLWASLRACAQLSQTFLYLLLSFVLADGVATLLAVVTIAQTRAVAFSARTNALMLTLQGGSAGLSALLALRLQERFALRSKSILHASNLCCLALGGWGLAGAWTATLGFHHAWEMWAANALYGVAFGNQWAFGQAFMAQLTPAGLENRFFALLGIVSKGGAWIGPLAASAVVDRTGNDWSAFGVVVALIGAPALALFFVDEEKSRVECERFLVENGGGS
ncbi:hypothetical protein MPH_06614 [Macrophomina phaseolina MS6]|uniref:Autophagy-related protein n=1 Tax=Macrophomina phaseolina (strain MS6) TaxID=1126212 RepID=K2RTZ3_MACPH|nr:hypothetical protein MPH_06614 [Macrophomina phaseolina MS6]